MCVENFNNETIHGRIIKTNRESAAAVGKGEITEDNMLRFRFGIDYERTSILLYYIFITL